MTRAISKAKLAAVTVQKTRLGSLALARIRMIGYCDSAYKSHSLTDAEAIKRFVEANFDTVLEWRDPIWRTADGVLNVVEVHLLEYGITERQEAE